MNDAQFEDALRRLEQAQCNYICALGELGQCEEELMDLILSLSGFCCGALVKARTGGGMRKRLVFKNKLIEFEILPNSERKLQISDLEKMTGSEIRSVERMGS